MQQSCKKVFIFGIMANVVIYDLRHPISNEIRYIGKAVDANKRFKRHLYYADKRNTPLYSWILSLRSKGLVPIMDVVKIVSEETWDSEEIKLIAEYRNRGVRLLNLADGGNEPYCSREIRAANGRANASKIHSTPDKKRIWQLKLAMGNSLKWLKQNGKIEKYNEIQSKLRLAGFNF